jgi:hypothetical protein
MEMNTCDQGSYKALWRWKPGERQVAFFSNTQRALEEERIGFMGGGGISAEGDRRRGSFGLQFGTHRGDFYCVKEEKKKNERDGDLLAPIADDATFMSSCGICGEDSGRHTTL